MGKGGIPGSAPAGRGCALQETVRRLNLALSVVDYGNSRKFTLMVVSISMGSPFSSVGA
jgi:hypothetical protein